ncbi:serine/threonine protein kinase [Pseudenhygromyxa sp. WMMC2535]|uniref:tetratricopeptide repeat protein n=1 Tax=Pseudenhygromyxa sp. WMMC2535 TaxID=2712867 RepID=UPI001555BB74|nr:tetratricopeptide repeat protein [Pseudenhygromyxa sp. WMMC2535]NVB39289.1 serine/threonine protein kinase [Pseudenhygromyxa sp. WMMC2535]
MITLDETKIAAYLDGSLDADERAAVEAALDRQPEWLRVVALLARDRQAARTEGSEPAPTEGSDSLCDDDCDEDSPDAAIHGHGRERRRGRVSLTPGTRVGRFEILRRLATGGMGVVHEAWDPTLERAVAVKIAFDRPRDPKARERQLREARTLARLSATNVVTVYDAGEHDGRIYLAMEKLSGPTLRTHLATARAGAGLSAAQIVGLFIEAARGLDAAHRKGVVHRDFKPDNVIVERERVVVVDFGLALRSDDERPGGDETLALAQTHSVAGTPAYMAGEQRRGEAVTARSDQYSLCVALTEALDAAQVRVSPQLRKIIDRGRAEDPRARYPDLGALITALERAMTRPRRLLRGAALGAAGLGLVAALLLARGEPPPVAVLLPEQSCAATRSELDATWNPAARERLATRLRSFEKPYLDEMATALGAAIDARAQAWTRARHEVCLALELGLESAQTHDLRVACLERRRDELELFLQLDWDEGDESSAARSLTALAELSPAAVCDDLELLRAATPLPETPAAREQAEALRRELAKVELLHSARRLEQAEALARELITRAEDPGLEPILAELHGELGWILVTAGDHDQASAELDAALLLAEASGHDLLLATLWVRKLWAEGHIQADLERGRAAAAHARAWLRRIGNPVELSFDYQTNLGWFEYSAGEPRSAVAAFEAALELVNDDHSRAVAHNSLGAALFSIGDTAGAEPHMRQATALSTALFGERHPETAKIRNNLAGLVRVLGDYDECARLFALNLDSFTEAYGPDHELVAQTEFNLAVLAADRGNYEQSLRYAGAARTKLAASLGEDHPIILTVQGLEADVLINLDRSEAGVALLREVLDAQRRTLGPEHPNLVPTHHNLGIGLAKAGRHQEALVEYERALALLASGKGEDHYELSAILINLGRAQQQLGRMQAAESAYRRAVELAVPMSEPEARSHLGRLLLERGRDEAGIEQLERALEGQRDLDADDVFMAQTTYALARALWERGEEDRARELAEEAAGLYLDNGDEQSAADARTWLARRK